MRSRPLLNMRAAAASWARPYRPSPAFIESVSHISRPAFRTAVPTTAPRLRAWPSSTLPQRCLPRRPFSAAQRRPYNYYPDDPRQHQHQPQRRVRGVVVGPGPIPVSGRGPSPDPMYRRALRSPSMRTVAALAVLAAFAFYFSNIEVVPVSGRKRFNFYSPESVEVLGQMEYKSIIRDVQEQGGRFLPDWDPRARAVSRVMQRLIPVSGMHDQEWEFLVVDDKDTANAFVLPGGKVFVFSGIFAVSKDDDGLATVLGHELAHILANHHGERASGSIGPSLLLFSMLFLSGFSAYFLLAPALRLFFSQPMDRRQESEADYIGLMMMAEACYDPREAVQFWRRMDRAQQVEPPEWMSTHPSNRTRIEDIQKWLPKAIERRENSECRGSHAYAEMFKRALRQGIVLGE